MLAPLTVNVVDALVQIAVLVTLELNVGLALIVIVLVILSEPDALMAFNLTV